MRIVGRKEGLGCIHAGREKFVVPGPTFLDLKIGTHLTRNNEQQMKAHRHRATSIISHEDRIDY